MSTHAERGSSKRARLMDDVKPEALILFFQFLDILPSRIPNILKEFVVVVATKDLDIIQSLFIVDNKSLFVDASCILFRVRSMVSMVAIGQEMY